MSSAPSRLHAATYAALDSPVLNDGTRVIRRPGWYQVYNPSSKDPSANEVMVSHLQAEEVDARIEETLSLYRSAQVPFKWSIGPMSSPESLERRLVPRASASWEFSGMAIDSDADLPASKAGVRVERVGLQGVDDFVSVNIEGWELQHLRAETESKLTRMATHPSCQCFVARAEGVAIGAAATLLKDGYGYLVGAVVLKQYRGRGAYGSLIEARLRELRAAEIAFAVTLARRATSAPILEAMGFERLYDGRIYRFDL